MNKEYMVEAASIHNLVANGYCVYAAPPTSTTIDTKYRQVGDDEPIEAGDFWFPKGTVVADCNIGSWGDAVSSSRVGKTINYFKEYNVGYPDHKLLYRKVKAPRKLTGNAYFSKELPLP